jgi:hypothetical protein
MRFIASWVLYWLGCAACWVMHVWDEYVGIGTFYPVYNRLMGWSSIVQGPSDNGPWEHVVEGGSDEATGSTNADREV